MNRIAHALLFIILFMLGQSAGYGAGARPLELYFIDVGWGNATLIVAPSGQTMLIDTGDRETAARVLDVLTLAGVKQIDYLVLTHYHSDHYGAVPELAAKIPIRTIVDHGPNVELGKGDDWWKGRRNDFQPGLGKETDEEFEAYVKTRDRHHHRVVRAGERITLGRAEVDVLAAAGETISHPLKGAGAPNPACAQTAWRAEDDTEDGQSIGVLVSYGRFRLAFLGDLTWNLERRLFCPDNRVGTADVYLITHHAQSFDRSYSDFYWGLSCCPPAEVFALGPRVAILSMGAEGHPLEAGATAAALELVNSSPGLKDVWQTNLLAEGGEKGHNAPDEYSANVAKSEGRRGYIKLLSQPDGSFTITNSRSGLTEHYPARASSR